MPENKDIQLYLAIVKQDLPMVKKLLSVGVNINSNPLGVGRPIHLAIITGSTEIVQNILQANPALDQLDALGRTPLLLAVVHARLDILKILIAADANLHARLVNKQDHFCKSALTYAIEQANIQVILQLASLKIKLKHHGLEENVLKNAKQDSALADAIEKAIFNAAIWQNPKTGAFRIWQARLDGALQMNRLEICFSKPSSGLINMFSDKLLKAIHFNNQQSVIISNVEHNKDYSLAINLKLMQPIQRLFPLRLKFNKRI